MSELKVIETKTEGYVKNAREFLVEKSGEGFERVIVMGFKGDRMHFSASSTPNIMEDVGACVYAILDRVLESRGK